MDRCRVDAPTASEMREPFGIKRGGIDLLELDVFERLGVIKTFQAQVELGLGDSALVPEGPARPGIGPLDLPPIGLHPGVRMSGSVGAEKLDGPELLAERHNEVETFVHVL